MAIAAFSSNAASAEAYESAKKEAKSTAKEAKTKVEAGEHPHRAYMLAAILNGSGDHSAEIIASCLTCQRYRSTYLCY